MTRVFLSKEERNSIMSAVLSLRGGMVDAADLKSVERIARTGSSPVGGTKTNYLSIFLRAASS